MDTLPFGGVGNSGMGRYRGKFGFDTFTHEKAVLKRAFFTERLIEFVSVTFFCKLHLSYVANILLKKGL